MGVYVGAATPTGVARFQTWNNNTPIKFAEDFLAFSSWSPIQFPNFWSDAWQGQPYRIVYSIPMLPSTGATMATGATGAYNFYFADMAANFIARGQGNAILRIGWEFNGNWYPWGNAVAATFVSYWQQIVTAIRGVTGANFKFDWNPTLGVGALGNPEPSYPGNTFVDYIGLDAYDQGFGVNYTDPVARWNEMLNGTYGLVWHRDLALAKGKPMSFPEWGLFIRSDGNNGGGDNPYYIQKMYDWMTTNNVGYQAYFEFDASDGQHYMEGTQFPNGAAKYRELFRA